MSAIAIVSLSLLLSLLLIEINVKAHRHVENSLVAGDFLARDGALVKRLEKSRISSITSVQVGLVSFSGRGMKRA